MPDKSCVTDNCESSDTITLAGVKLYPYGTVHSGAKSIIKIKFPWDSEGAIYVIPLGYTNRLRAKSNNVYRSVEFLGVTGSYHNFTVCEDEESSWWWSVLVYIFGDLMTLLEDTYDMLKKSWSDVTGAISTAIDGLQGWTKKTFSDATDDFITGFQSKFIASETRAVAFLTALGIGAGDVITTILDTPADMFLWIQGEIENAYDIVNHAWSDVTGAISTAIDDLSDIVDHTWLDVTDLIPTWEDLKPDWVWASLADFKVTLVSYVSETFESILDKVFEKEKEE